MVLVLIGVAVSVDLGGAMRVTCGGLGTWTGTVIPPPPLARVGTVEVVARLTPTTISSTNAIAPNTSATTSVGAVRYHRFGFQVTEVG